MPRRFSLAGQDEVNPSGSWGPLTGYGRILRERGIRWLLLRTAASFRRRPRASLASCHPEAYQRRSLSRWALLEVEGRSQALEFRLITLLSSGPGL